MFSGSIPNITQLSPGTLRLLTKLLGSGHRAWTQFSREFPRRASGARCPMAFADWALAEVISRDSAKLFIRL